MSHFLAPSTPTSICDSSAASRTASPRSARHARLKAKQAELKQIMDSSERERADHERRILKIREDRPKKQGDVYHTFQEMKDVIELSKTRSAELHVTLEMVSGHNQYMSATRPSQQQCVVDSVKSKQPCAGGKQHRPRRDPLA
jgi:hypothetical protein